MQVFELMQLLAERRLADIDAARCGGYPAHAIGQIEVLNLSQADHGALGARGLVTGKGPLQMANERPDDGVRLGRVGDDVHRERIFRGDHCDIGEAEPRRN